ncbi:hypothetical protein Tco_0562344 [Tanacetum coccineum]
MEFEFAQSNTTTKLPILKLGKYEMWVIRIKQYFQVQDYALWEVIENGNSWVSVPQTTQENGTSVTKMSVPVTAEEKTNKKNDVKARSLLLMAIPNEHQLTFSQYSDAKTMFAAIKTRFEEDLNSKFLRSLPPKWNTHVVVWMNKADIKTMSINDLYNNFKIVKQDVKKSIGANSGAQNIAFMTAPSTSSTNVVNTANPAYEVSTINSNINTACAQDLEKIHKDDLEAMDLKWHLSLLSIGAKRYGKSKVECFNCHCHKMRHFVRECRAPRNKEGQFKNQDNTRKQGNNEDTYSKAMLAIDGVDFDSSDMTEEQVQTNMALMAFSDFELNQTEFTAATYKRGLATAEEQLITYRKNEVLFSKEVVVLKREVACKDYEINVLKSEFEKVRQEKEGIEFKIEKFDKASKDLDNLLGSQIIDKSKKGLGYNVVPPVTFRIFRLPSDSFVTHFSIVIYFVDYHSLEHPIVTIPLLPDFGGVTWRVHFEELDACVTAGSLAKLVLCNCDIKTGHRLKALNCSYLYVSYGAEYCIIPAHLVSQPYLVYMGPFFILDKLSEVAESSLLVDKIKYVFGRSRGEDESFAGLMRDLCLSLRISLSKKRRLVAELEAVGEVGVSLKAGFVADMEVSAVTKDKEFEYLWSCSYLSLVCLIPWDNSLIYIYILSVKLLTMAALYILDKLAEVVDSSRLQDKMKVVFVQARGADESFIALMRDLCSVLRVSIAKNRRLIAELEILGQLAEALKPLDYMKEMVVRDSITLGVLEQLLAGTHVGMRLKASYVVEMEETE